MKIKILFESEGDKSIIDLIPENKIEEKVLNLIKVGFNVKCCAWTIGEENKKDSYNSIRIETNTKSI